MKKEVVIMLFFFMANGIYALNVLEKNNKEPWWGQSGNNDGNNATSPTYNMYCPKERLVGCGAVAAGQVMWKYEWPLLSSYGYVDWGQIPADLHNGDSDDLPKLLRNIGKAVDMNYEEFLGVHDWGFKEVTGSWCLPSDLEDGLDTYNYNVRRHKWTDWRNYGDSWNDLIRSELDCGRPVIMFGQKDWGVFDMYKAHYFVVDGYVGTNPEKYDCNMGWKGSNQTEDIRNSDKFSYHAEQQLYVVTPYYPDMKTNVTSYSSTKVKNDTQINAKKTISLPASGSTLTVESGATLVLAAGKEVKLNSGFTAKSGSVVRSVIKPEFQHDFDIKYEQVNKFITPKCADGINDYVTFKVTNADSWETEVYDRWGKALWRAAGLVKDGIAKVWDGSSATHLEEGSYWLVVSFKNSYGRIVTPSPFPIAYTPKIAVSDLRPNQKVISPYCVDGINDDLVYTSDCAETFVCYIFDRSGKEIGKKSGRFVNGVAKVWDGSLYSSVHPSHLERLFLSINCTNSLGGSFSEERDIYYSTGSCNTLRSLRFDENGEVIDPTLDDDSFGDDSEPMSIIDEKEGTSISIFPNPTEGMVTVDFSEVQTGKLLVTDITGKVVLDRLVNAEKSLTLDLSANRSGLYVIKCIFSDTTLTARVLLK